MTNEEFLNVVIFKIVPYLRLSLSLTRIHLLEREHLQFGTNVSEELSDSSFCLLP
jgi:hypothetical protein